MQFFFKDLSMGKTTVQKILIPQALQPHKASPPTPTAKNPILWRG